MALRPTASVETGRLAFRLAGLAWLVLALDTAKNLLAGGGTGGSAHAIPGGPAGVGFLVVALGLAWRVGLERRAWAARLGVVVGLLIAAYGLLAQGLDQVAAFGNPRLLVLVAGLLIALLNLAAAVRAVRGGGPRPWPNTKESEATREHLANAVGEEEGPISRRSRFGKEIFHPD